MHSLLLLSMVNILVFACFRKFHFSVCRSALKGLFTANRSGHEIVFRNSKVLANNVITTDNYVYSPCPCTCSPVPWVDLPQSSSSPLPALETRAEHEQMAVGYSPVVASITNTDTRAIVLHR